MKMKCIPVLAASFWVSSACVCACTRVCVVLFVWVFLPTIKYSFWSSELRQRKAEFGGCNFWMHKTAALISGYDWHQTKCRLSLCSPKRSGILAGICGVGCACGHTCICVCCLFKVRKRFAKFSWQQLMNLASFKLSPKKQFWWQA